MRNKKELRKALEAMDNHTFREEVVREVLERKLNEFSDVNLVDVLLAGLQSLHNAVTKLAFLLEEMQNYDEKALEKMMESVTARLMALQDNTAPRSDEKKAGDLSFKALRDILKHIQSMQEKRETES